MKSSERNSGGNTAMASTSTARPAPFGTVAGESNPRGIPKALFIEKIPDFVDKNGGNSDEILQKIQETYSKYKFMESNLTQRKSALKGKVPEIKSALKALDYLMKKKDAGEACSTSFELSDTLYAQAEIDNPESCCLWLGANVMVEYSFDEAKELLTKNKTTAENSLSEVEEDMKFLRSQLTTTEVNIARIYNHDVKTRRSKQTAAEEVEE